MSSESTASRGDSERRARRRRWVALACAHAGVLFVGLAYFKTIKLQEVLAQVDLPWSTTVLAYAQEFAVAGLWFSGLLLMGGLVAQRKWVARSVLAVVVVAEAAAFFYGMFNVHYFRLFGIPLNIEAMSDVEHVGGFKTTIAPFLESIHTVVAAILSLFAVLIPITLRLKPIGEPMGTFAAWVQRIFGSWRAPVIGGVALATIVLIPIDRYELAKNDLVEMVSSAGRVFLEEDVEIAQSDELTNKVVLSYHDPDAMIEPSIELKRLKKRFLRANEERPMNVVIIVLESMVSPDVAHELDIDDVMPFTYSLTSNSIFFEDYSTVFPLSMKSLISLTCSILPSPERLTLTKINPRLDCRSVGEVATQRGYRAGLFHSGRFAFTMKDLYFEDRGFEKMVDAEILEAQNPDYENDFWSVQEEAAVGSMLDWIDGESSQPFLAMYVPVAGHFPYTPLNARFRGAHGIETKVERYKNAVSYADAMVKDVVEGLEQRGLADDTVFVILGDHGLPLDLHPNNDTQSAFIYEENVRTLAYIYQPRLIKDTVRYPHIVQHYDMLPTLYDLLGWDTPDRYAGVSIFRPYRKKMAIHYTLRSRKLAALRDGDVKAIVDLRNGEGIVFDLAKDPTEQDDIIDQHQEFYAHAEQFFAEFLPAHASYIVNYPVLKAGAALPPAIAKKVREAADHSMDREQALAKAEMALGGDTVGGYRQAESLLLPLMQRDDNDFEALVLLMRTYDRLSIVLDPARYEGQWDVEEIKESDPVLQLAQRLRATIRARFPDREDELERVLMWSALRGPNSRPIDQASRFLGAWERFPDDPEVAALGTRLIYSARARGVIRKAGVPLEDAFEKLEAHVEKNPDDWFVARELFLLMGGELLDPVGAFALCDVECGLASNNLTKTIDVAEMYYRNGMFGEARKLLDRAMVLAEEEQLSAPVPWITSRLGAIAFLLGDYETATEWLTQTIEADPKRTLAVSGLAMIALRSGDEETAERETARAKKLKRPANWPLTAQGEWLGYLGERKKSRKAYGRGSTWKILVEESRFYSAMRTEDYPGANRWLKSLVRKTVYDPQRFEHYAALSTLLAERDEGARVPSTIEDLKALNAQYQPSYGAWRAANRADTHGLRRRAVAMGEQYLVDFPDGSRTGAIRKMLERLEEGTAAQLIDDEETEESDQVALPPQ
jgi:phosphoglycerol transferase MdoB-like AlkP superfamily enzyme/tetratricopeptide (TPR) repeat protein